MVAASSVGARMVTSTHSQPIVWQLMLDHVGRTNFKDILTTAMDVWLEMVIPIINSS